MGMIYDQELVNQWRKSAITEVENLNIGQTYYSNRHGEFELLELLTDKQFCELNDIPIGSNPDKVTWMKTSKGFNSLEDNNIGASYNPWLIFSDESLCTAYGAQLIITFEKDVFEDIFDDMIFEATDYNYDYDE